MSKEKLGILGLMGVCVVVLGTLVALGHDSAITDALLAVCGGSGVLGLWTRTTP
jgi:hypothetical protein